MRRFFLRRSRVTTPVVRSEQYEQVYWATLQEMQQLLRPSDDQPQKRLAA
jgi:hypothetical protein